MWARRLTVKLRGRVTTPDGGRGRTLSCSLRGAQPPTPHGPLQRLLGRLRALVPTSEGRNTLVLRFNVVLTDTLDRRHSPSTRPSVRSMDNTGHRRTSYSSPQHTKGCHRRSQRRSRQSASSLDPCATTKENSNLRRRRSEENSGFVQ